MGISILEMVVQHLRQKGFPADIAYPGQKYPQITRVVAAVHILTVDRSGRTVTLEVNVLCPGAMGGTQCELEALRATELLRQLGGRCIQKGCRYDGAGQVYVVPIDATFTAMTEAESHVMGPGYHVYIDEQHHPHVVSFAQEQHLVTEPVEELGRSRPAAQVPQQSWWSLRLEELIPVGAEEQPQPRRGFTLKVVTGSRGEIYTGCLWQSIRREYTALGLRRICQGTAAGKKEVTQP